MRNYNFKIPFIQIKDLIQRTKNLPYLLTATDLDVQLLVIRGMSRGTWVC